MPSRLGRIQVSGWGVHGPGDYSTLVMFCLRRRPVIVLALGWGWDNEHPLQLWPRYTASRSPGNNLHRCVSCCGFFADWVTP